MQCDGIGLYRPAIERLPKFRKGLLGATVRRAVTYFFLMPGFLLANGMAVVAGLL